MTCFIILGLIGGFILMAMKKYSISEFARELGVSTQTLRRWDLSGKFRANRTPSGRFYYTDSDLHNYLLQAQAEHQPVSVASSRDLPSVRLYADLRKSAQCVLSEGLSAYLDLVWAEFANYDGSCAGGPHFYGYRDLYDGCVNYLQETVREANEVRPQDCHISVPSHLTLDQAAKVFVAGFGVYAYNDHVCGRKFWNYICLIYDDELVQEFHGFLKFCGLAGSDSVFSDYRDLLLACAVPMVFDADQDGLAFTFPEFLSDMARLSSAHPVTDVYLYGLFGDRMIADKDRRWCWSVFEFFRFLEHCCEGLSFVSNSDEDFQMTPDQILSWTTSDYCVSREAGCYPRFVREDCIQHGFRGRLTVVRFLKSEN